MKKHAYMIIAHNQFALLELLLKMLDDVRNDLFIHIDEKVRNFDFKYFSGLCQFSKVVFTPERVNITWGNDSQIQCEMLLLQTAVASEDKNNPYAYYHLLSGVDLPIKTNAERYAFFAKNEGKEFVHFSQNEPFAGAELRIRYYHIFRKKRNTFYKILAQIALKLQQLAGVNRLKNQNLKVYKGTNWFSITGDFAKYIVSKRDFIANTFNRSYCGDEIFLQTMLMNSPFQDNLYMPNCNNNQLACARLIDWQRGNPYTFQSEDFDEIISSPAMFARKFDLRIDQEIVQKIYSYVEAKANERQC